MDNYEWSFALLKVEIREKQVVRGTDAKQAKLA